MRLDMGLANYVHTRVYGRPLYLAHYMHVWIAHSLRRPAPDHPRPATRLILATSRPPSRSGRYRRDVGPKLLDPAFKRFDSMRRAARPR
jgi:hypothetical protein